jgi:hypothetical protein
MRIPEWMKVKAEECGAYGYIGEVEMLVLEMSWFDYRMVYNKLTGKEIDSKYMDDVKVGDNYTMTLYVGLNTECYDGEKDIWLDISGPSGDNMLFDIEKRETVERYIAEGKWSELAEMALDVE